MKLSLVSLAFSSCLGLVASLFEGDSAVKHLTSSNFGSLVDQSIKPVLVAFYSTTCPHCVRLAPIWSRVARNLAGHIPVMAINCQQDSLCSRYPVQGVPTIRIFLRNDDGATRGSLYFLEYQGAREAAAIEDWAKKYATSFVQKVSDAKADGKKVNTISKFLETTNLPKIMMLKKDTLAPSLALKTLSVDYNQRLLVGITNISLDKAALEKQLELTIPTDKDTLIYFRKGEPKARIYDGPLRFPDMKQFIESQLVGDVTRPGSDTSKGVTAKEEL